MGRRRDDDDDDDDDDDIDDDRPVRRPEKSGGGGGKIVLIVLGIVGVVLLIIVGTCGFLMYRGVTGVRDAAYNLEDSAKARAECDSFLTKLSTDQTQLAYESTSPEFKASISRDRLQQMINQNPLLTKNFSRRAMSFNAPTGTTPNRKHTMTYELTKPFDDPTPFPQPGQPAKPPGPRTITITITVAEQPGGFWKVENLTIP